MRLLEITRPDPEAAEAARRAEPCYRRVFDAVLARLAKSPPDGVVVDRRRRLVYADPADLGIGMDDAGDSLIRKDIERFLRSLGYEIVDWSRGLARRVHGGRDLPVEKVVSGIIRAAEKKGRTDREAMRHLDALRSGRKRPDLDAFLRRHGWFRLGDVAVDMRNPLVRIGRVLRRTAERRMSEISDQAWALLRRFENDPTRSGRRRVKWRVVLSFDPIETAHMSIRRGWRSCAAYPSVLRRELEALTLTAWLTDESDAIRLDRPTARVSVHPFVHESSDGISIMLIPDRTVYGTAPSWFVNAVGELAERVSRRLVLHPEALHRAPGEFSSFHVAHSRAVIPAGRQAAVDVLMRSAEDVRPRDVSYNLEPDDLGRWAARNPDRLGDLVAFLESVARRGERPAAFDLLLDGARALESLVSKGRIPRGLYVTDVLRAFAAAGGRPNPVDVSLRSGDLSSALELAATAEDVVRVLDHVARRGLRVDLEEIVRTLDRVRPDPTRVRELAQIWRSRYGPIYLPSWVIPNSPSGSAWIKGILDVEGQGS